MKDRTKEERVTCPRCKGAGYGKGFNGKRCFSCKGIGYVWVLKKGSHFTGVAEVYVTKNEYYPCIMDKVTGRISVRKGPVMTREQAVEFLRKNYKYTWLACEAIPQPVNHSYFK